MLLCDLIIKKNKYFTTNLHVITLHVHSLFHDLQIRKKNEDKSLPISSVKMEEMNS